MRALALILAASVALAGCGTTGPLKVPIPVTCKVKLPPEPDYAFDNLPEGADIFTQVKTLLSDRELDKDYKRQLRAAAEVCS